MAILKKLGAIAGLGPTRAVRAVGRKLVYRSARMGRYGFRAGDAIPPAREHPYAIEIWGPERFDEILVNNDNLTAFDLERFRNQTSSVIVVLDEGQVVASSWMTRGGVWVTDLQRAIEVPAGEHFSCRSWVSPTHRGQSLFSHMVFHYARSVPADDEVWGLVYYWNTASVRSLANIGWLLSGDYRCRWLFDRPHLRIERFPARPAFEGSGVFIP